MNTFKERLNHAMTVRNIKPSELAKRSGISKSRISQYMSGLYTPKSKGTLSLAIALNVSETWLMGLNTPMERISNEDIYQYSNIHPITTKKFPMLGEIACGEPIMCNEDFETFIEASADINADFCLTAKGDSMINARIYDGDIVFIKNQPIVNNGEIAAVIIEGDATLKRVYLRNDKITLRPDNPLYDDIVYEKEEMNAVRILGKAVAFMSLVR